MNTLSGVNTESKFYNLLVGPIKLMGIRHD